MFRTVIPRNIRLAEAPSFGKPVLFHDKESRGALAYLALAGEMIRREEVASGMTAPRRRRRAEPHAHAAQPAAQPVDGTRSTAHRRIVTARTIGRSRCPRAQSVPASRRAARR